MGVVGRGVCAAGGIRGAVAAGEGLGGGVGCAGRVAPGDMLGHSEGGTMTVAPKFGWAGCVGVRACGVIGAPQS